MAAKVKHLLDRAGRYWARMSVPKGLRGVIVKRELLRALGPDRREALRQLPAAVAEMQAEIDTARAMASPRPPSARNRPLYPRQIAAEHYASELAIDDADRADPDALGYDPGLHAELFRDGYRRTLAKVAAGRTSNDETAAAIGWAINAFAERGNTSVEAGSPEWRSLARTLAGVQLEVLKRAAERDQGNYAGAPSHPALTKNPDAFPSDPLAVRRISPQSDLPLSELSETYIQERGATPSVNRELEVAVRMLEEFFGEARPVYRIARQDVLAFKRALAETPSNYVARFPSLKLPDAIKANKARATPFPVLSARTIGNKYLSRIHTLLNWCVQNDILPDSPAAGIKVDSVRDREPPRVNFSPGDLSKIFSRDRFDTSKLAEPQWAELISLFTGARASELGQVKLDSIRTERGVLVMRVEEETKNRGSQRLIPVHQKLIALRLEQYIQELRAKGEDRLFPVWHRKATEAKANATNGDGKALLNHYYPRYFPKVFNRGLAKIGIADPRVSWHSFRHTFKSALAAAGVARSIQDQLCGHADGTAGARYIHSVSIEALHEAITRLHFDGFNL